MLRKITNYLKGVRGEVNRVSWPSRNEVISLTALILLMVIVLSVYIWGVDTIVQAVITSLIQL